MTATTTDPIPDDWSTIDGNATSDREVGTSATAADVSARLARLDVSDIGPDHLPFLAVAAAELASIAGIPWRFSTDDPAVVLVRLIAKATIRCPDASGPHTGRLLARLP